MISNLNTIKSGSISRTVCYALNQDSASVILSNTIAGLQGDTREITSHLSSVAELNERVEQPLYHISLRCAPDEEVSPVEWSEISEQFLELMELKDNPFLAVAHGDNHVHLLVSRVDYQGNCYQSSWDRYKAQDALRTIESERGYRQVLSSWEVGRCQDTPGQVHRIKKEQHEYEDGIRDEPPEPSLKRQLQDAVDEGIKQSSCVEEVKEFLAQKDIQTRQTKLGWSFQIGDVPFAGYQLGSKYTLPAVVEALEPHLTPEHNYFQPE
ncbi:MAG: relaxase/mobilization nuclease domain-containing protein, partial [Spirulinaceae cyanobacterium]